MEKHQMQRREDRFGHTINVLRAPPTWPVNPLLQGRHLPMYLDSGGLQTVIHSLSSYIFGQYDGVAGGYNTGGCAHSACGRRDSLEGFQQEPGSGVLQAGTRSQPAGSSLRAEVGVKETRSPLALDNSFPKS